ncbi:hypothetical protein H6G81_02800 [Scytonema hofmannii FACHB-248]|uniref:Uncharacterized protein n=1 Tax=Scytonema hofmannii FACHB-248 TaxID=1842502 RepID=A0ABR8GJC5_9CYAN|nr:MULTISPECIES: hypothetical protein [Nostocales]MBD2603484.1 hypothetical protein [Scytonema hofmannii FACHB-248]
MSAKLKLFLIFILSIFATVAAGFYIMQRQPSASSSSNYNGQQQFSAIPQAQHIEVYAERATYKTIPLENLNSALQGSDPATLALNAFDDVVSQKATRKVEVVYPQPNQAMVTITQMKQADNAVDTVKYRVEMTTFGRSLLVSSPPVWQIVWAGSQLQCWSGNRPQKNSISTCG